MSRRTGSEEIILLEDDPLWYKDAIIYELHVRAFHDSDGDGVGDFRGLVEKLDYLQDLGVTALWLLPFYPSPLRDDGYDIADYNRVHPIYGNLGDFKVLLREAHSRGLRVITELVLNHTSDQHPWFQRARRAKPGEPARDFYVWSDTADKYPEARIIFKDFEPSNWTWDPIAKAYFWHRFYSHQPDLNFDNPEVQKATFEILDFWLNMGIDGLRLDAVPYLYEREGTNGENLPETHAFLKKLRRHVDEKFKNRMLLAEANQWPEDAVAYFGNGDECQMAFHFPVMPRLFMAIRMEDRFPIIDILHQTPPIPEMSQWALFLRNHDELTLEMVTDEDRDYMYRVYAQDPQARINLGIRRRLAPLLENHRGKMELMNGLLFSLPGTPVLYYGDEIGMGDNIYLGDRNGVRTPMQWRSERNAGFSRTNPQRLYLPVIIDPEYHFEALNVEAQQNNPHSLLWWMKHLIALRKRYQAFGRGSLEFLFPENPKVLAFVRRYQEERILVVANLSRFVQCAELDMSAYQGMIPTEMLGRTAFPRIGDLPYFITLSPHAFYWFLLERERSTPLDGEAAMPFLKTAGRWENVFRGRGRLALEELLPQYLRARSWFVGKNRTVKAATIAETIPVPQGESQIQLTLVQVEFTEGDGETYVLPLGFATGKQADALKDGGGRNQIVSLLQVRGKTGAEEENQQGILFEAVGDKGFSQGLLQCVTRRRRCKGTSGDLAAVAVADMRSLSREEVFPEPSLVKVEQRHSSIAFGDRWVLKLLRRIEEGNSPELEVGRFLAEHKSFPHAPLLVGAIEYQRERKEPMTVAVVHEFVQNQGDVWRLTLDSLGRYFEQALTGGQAQIPDLTPPRNPWKSLFGADIPEVVPGVIGPFLESARLLGQRTAEMHLALASAPDDPGFAPEPFTPMYQRSLYQSIRSQIRRALDLLRRRLKSLSEAERDKAQKVLGGEEELLRQGKAVMDRKIQASRIRCHGDYHLGQILYTGKDFVVIDFEGEATRPLSDRRRKRHPLRDVASMIRSFHYASLVAMKGGVIRPEDVPNLALWARYWHHWVSVVFAKAYLEAARGAVFLPKTSDEIQVLLDFHLIKRAIFELRNDLTYHPERVYVPLEGLLNQMDH